LFIYLDGWFNLDGSYYLHMTEDWVEFTRR
jgi:hypothetical protein